MCFEQALETMFLSVFLPAPPTLYTNCYFVGGGVEMEKGGDSKYSKLLLSIEILLLYQP